jgi:hypothetical protein
MGLVAIDETKTARVVIYLSRELVRRVNAYRASQAAATGKMPSQSAALAELIEKALEAAERDEQKS